MPNYLFEFTAHIDERKRPEGFPRQLVIRESYENIPSDEVLRELYNERLKVMAISPVLVFTDDIEHLIPESKFDKRIEVPWHMITYFHGSVKLVIPPPEPSALDVMIPVEEEKKKQTIQ